MPKLLTKRKQAWADKRKPDVIRGGALNVPAPLTARYDSALVSMVRRMCDIVESQLEKFFESDHADEFFAQDATTAAQAKILTNKLMARFNTWFASLAPDVASTMVNQANKASSAAVHTSLQELSGGLSLPTSALSQFDRQVLNASITENVALIKSISAKYLPGVQAATMRSIASGNGKPQLLDYLKKQRGITERRAKFIALDQTRKAFNSLSAARATRLGLDDYEWLHTGGSAHPRQLHIDMNGKIYKLSNPPIIDERTGERGKPGDAPGCRCRMRLIVKFGD